MRAERAERTERLRWSDIRSLLSRRCRFSAFAAFAAFAVLSALSLCSPHLQAQQSTIAAGRVLVPRAADTVPLGGARVLLHRVGRDLQGPVDSVTADRAGRFRFRFRADTAALYLLSTRYGGIEYFSTPVHTNPARPDTAMTVLAYDTSSTAPIAVEARHIVVPRPAQDGSRSVLDLIVLRNDGIHARVAPDSAHPSWSFVLPQGTGEMQVGESDVSPDAVRREGDTVKVLAPLAPGQKQLSIEYAAVPVKGRIAFAAGSSDTPVNLLVEERGVRVTGGALALADSQVIEGRSFRRYTGRVPAGATITLGVGTDRAGTSGRALAVLVGAVAVVLALGALRLVRRPRGSGNPAAAVAQDSATLLDAIAALDARYVGREGEVSGEEWASYRSERARLKARLEQALAGGEAAPYV